MERTLIIIKPDLVEKNVIGDVIAYFERNGLIVRNIRSVRAEREILWTHYETIGLLHSRLSKKFDEDKSLEIVNQVIDYMMEGLIVPIALEGVDAVSRVRDLIGATDPSEADPSSLRALYCSGESRQLANAENRAVRNGIHASAVIEEAEKELVLWFPEE